MTFDYMSSLPFCYVDYDDAVLCWYVFRVLSFSVTLSYCKISVLVGSDTWQERSLCKNLQKKQYFDIIDPLCDHFISLLYQRSVDGLLQTFFCKETRPHVLGRILLCTVGTWEVNFANVYGTTTQFDSIRQVLKSVFDPHEHHMDLCNQSSASWPSLVMKTWTLTLYVNFPVKFFFIFAMLTGTIDLYHFIPLSVTLTLALGHKVCAKQSLVASFPCTLFNWSGWNLMCGSNPS